MLAETVARLAGVVPSDNILVVTSRRLRSAVRAELPQLPSTNVLCEPIGRNTAPCIGWAAIELRRRDADAVMSVLPADHVVRPRAALARALRKAMALADQREVLVTLGIEPSFPATGYGYIRCGAPLVGEPGVFSVRRFCEKPSLAKAKRFVTAGDYYWNSGMFAWRADVILAAIGRHLPDLSQALRRIDQGRRGRQVSRAVLDRVFPRLPSISIDYGVMEKESRVVLLPAPFEWSDIGSWDAVGELWPSDSQENRSRDPLLAVEASGNVVATRGKPVALLGVKDLTVVDSGDALLICPRSRAEEVRVVVDALGRAGWKKLR